MQQGNDHDEKTTVQNHTCCGTILSASRLGPSLTEVARFRILPTTYDQEIGTLMSDLPRGVLGVWHGGETEILSKRRVAPSD
jgi:hypothetical protein